MPQQFNKYKAIINGPTAPEVRDPRLLMHSEGSINIYYAPFEYINPEARIVLVGITPGPTQMSNANNNAHQALKAGHTDQEAIVLAKKAAAFSGEPMRTNLINQLNHWGFHHWLDIHDAADLFKASCNLVQSTSLLRYPVFVNGKDYRGTPDMMRTPILREHLHKYFVSEVSELPNALFIALGPQVSKIMSQLVKEGVLDGTRVINGLLHPSGNCTYRIKYLLGDRSTPIPHATNPVPYDEGRAYFRSNYVNN